MISSLLELKLIPPLKNTNTVSFQNLFKDQKFSEFWCPYINAEDIATYNNYTDFKTNYIKENRTHILSLTTAENLNLNLNFKLNLNKKIKFLSFQIQNRCLPLVRLTRLVFCQELCCSVSTSNIGITIYYFYC